MSLPFIPIPVHILPHPPVTSSSSVYIQYCKKPKHAGRSFMVRACMNILLIKTADQTMPTHVGKRGLFRAIFSPFFFRKTNTDLRLMKPDSPYPAFPKWKPAIKAQRKYLNIPSPFLVLPLQINPFVSKYHLNSKPSRVTVARSGVVITHAGAPRSARLEEEELILIFFLSLVDMF